MNDPRQTSYWSFLDVPHLRVPGATVTVLVVSALSRPKKTQIPLFLDDLVKRTHTRALCAITPDAVVGSCTSHAGPARSDSKRPRSTRTNKSSRPSCVCYVRTRLKIFERRYVFILRTFVHRVDVRRHVIFYIKSAKKSSRTCENRFVNVKKII